MNYLVSDFVIRLKNASMARRREAILPYSSINKAIGDVLVRKHFLDKIKGEEQNGKKVLIGVIRFEHREPTITDVTIVSKPSLRVYTKAKDMTKVERKRLSTIIVSTSMGVMTGKEAYKKGIGGEFLFEIW